LELAGDSLVFKKKKKKRKGGDCYVSNFALNI